MISFVIKDGHLTVDAKALTVPQFNSIWEYRVSLTSGCIPKKTSSRIPVSNPGMRKLVFLNLSKSGLMVESHPDVK